MLVVYYIHFYQKLMSCKVTVLFFIFKGIITFALYRGKYFFEVIFSVLYCINTEIVIHYSNQQLLLPYSRSVESTFISLKALHVKRVDFHHI